MAAFIRGMSRDLFIIGRSSVFRKINVPVSDSKRYIRALKRKPVNVWNSDGEIGVQFKSNQIPLKNKQTNHQKIEVPKRMTKGGNVSQFTEEVKTYTKDQLGGLRFEKALPGDKRLGKVVSVARSRTFREQQGKILLEGRRLICDALAAGAVPQTLFFSSVQRLRDLPLDKLQCASLVKVKFEEIKTWSDLVTPQGVIAIFSRPDASRLAFPKDQRSQSVPLSLICDNVRDPGNLGTILRCAAAAGCDGVLLTNGCVDAWEPKVLRAAMGAHFRLPIFSGLDWEDIPGHLPKNVTVHVADNCSDPTRGAETGSQAKPSSAKQPGGSGWVGNRESRKHLRREECSESDSGEDSDNEEEKMDEFSLPRVEPKVYHESWARRSTGLVIGGESHGLSLEALQLAEKTDGQRLFVPVAPGVDSLNSAMAASILLFEGRRQLLKLLERPGRSAKS